MKLLLFASSSAVSWPITLLFALILVGLIVCLALEEKIHAKKSVIAAVFAIICLALGAVFNLLPFNKIVVGSQQVIEVEHLEGDVVDEINGSKEPQHFTFHAAGADDDTHTGTATGAAAGKAAGGTDDHATTHADDAHADDDAHKTPPVHIQGHRLSSPVYIPGIDWSVIAIILGSSLFVDVTSKSGLFTWIALKVTKASGGDPLKLLVFYGVMTVVFSAVLNNVTAMIIVGSLTYVSLEKLQKRDKLPGFLLIEGLLTNIGGLLTLISSVPNIIVGGAAGITFVTFFLKAAPYVVVATILTLAMGAWWFRITRLKTDKEKEEAANLVATFDETNGVESWSFFYFAAAMLGLFIVAIATTSILPLRLNHLGMGFVALAFAGVMLVRYKAHADDFYRNVDWDLLGFFMCLFVIIYVMEYAMVLKTIGDGMQYMLPNLASSGTPLYDSSALLLGAAGFSSVTDNIPLAAMLANILGRIGTPDTSGLWWSVIFGANLGGNLTPIGSASTLVAVTIMHKHKVPMTFAKFVVTAFPFAAVHIVLAVIYVLFILPLIPV